MEKKKVLYIITLAEAGGAQKYVFDLAKNLDKNRYEVAVASYGKKTDWLFENLEKEGIQTYPLKNLRRSINPIYDTLAIFEIKKLISSIKPDIVHLNSSKAGIIGSIASKKSNAKVVYTAHGFVFNEPMSYIKKRIYIFAERLSSKYKDKVISISNFDYKTGLKNKIATKNKFAVIHNGIKTDEFHFLSKSDARKRLGLSEKEMVIGTIANYYKTKSLNRIIDAAKIITKQHKNTKFLLIGDGPEKEKLQRQIEDIGLLNNFFIGPMKDAWSILKAFDVFVLPSSKEGMPYVVLEAMLAEVPIIATRVGGVPEMITNGENGFLVDSSDKTSEQLADKIKYYTNHKEIIPIFTNKGYRKILSDFTLNKMIQETEKIYNN